MRLYGNLMNRIAEAAPGPVPNVGDGATIFCYSDRHAATVTAVNTSKSGKTVTVELTEDKVTEWKDDYGVSFEPNPDGRRYTVKRARNGVWRTVGFSKEGVSFGRRSAYYDRGF